MTDHTPRSVISLRRITRYLGLYPKKRGNRLTGSRRVGTAGLTLFFAGMVFLGVCFFAVTFTMLVLRERREWRVKHEFIETSCRILDKRPDPLLLREKGLYRPLFCTEYPAHDPKWWDRESNGTWKEEKGSWWDIHGTSFSDQAECKAILNRYQIGRIYPCWYDPLDPAPRAVVLNRDGRTSSGYVWLTLFLPGTFILLGGGGLAFRLVNWGMSAEHRKSWARSAARVSPKDVTLSAGDYPTIPHDFSLTDSPGTRLAYRLPAASTGGWALLAMLIGCVVSGAMVSVFITSAIYKAWQREFDFLLVLASLLFAGLTGWLVYRCLKRLTHVAHLGRTFVEISDHPLHPGTRCRICLVQFGRMRMRRLRLSLRCVEKTTYQQGTNTRTESRVVAEQTVFTRVRFVIKPNRPLEIEREFQIPEEAMHSFRAPRNEVAWMLHVEASPRRWPNFYRTFPIIVHPASNGELS